MEQLLLLVGHYCGRDTGFNWISSLWCVEERKLPKQQLVEARDWQGVGTNPNLSETLSGYCRYCQLPVIYSSTCNGETQAYGNRPTIKNHVDCPGPIIAIHNIAFIASVPKTQVR